MTRGGCRERDPAFRIVEGRAAFVARPNPLVVAWRWRYEIILATGVPAGVFAVVAAGYAAWLVGTVALVVAVLTTWPGVRQAVRGRFWVVVTQHRIRRGCAEALIVNRRGRLPAVLWTRAVPYGERVWLWCRAGMTASDFEKAGPTLAVACWAAEVRVVRQERARVALDVIRYPERWSDPGMGERPRPERAWR